MISALDSKILDINSEILGIKVNSLMSNAGKALADFINSNFQDKKILFICGKGNNGGDGYAAANIIRDADTAMIEMPRTDAAKNEYDKLTHSPMQYRKELLNDYDILVDCALGTGLKGSVRSPYLEYILDMNNSGKIIISCDVPSGLGCPESIIPQYTVTFHDIKEGMTEQNCGRIVIADIGIPKDASELILRGDMLRYPIPKKDAHKGQNGRLLIIGGGPYTGAPALSGMAALRSGVDLVRIATPESSFIPVASASPSFVMERLPGDHLTPSSVGLLLKLTESADAVLIGPGLGLDPDTIRAVKEFTEKCDVPMVIDADGITAVAGDIPKKAIIFTPHHAEFQRISKGNDLKTAAKENECIIVLKGPTDLISDGKRIRKNISGNNAMTVGGTGDVLAGIISGLLSKGMTGFDAGCLGTYICGKAGERSFDEFSYGLVATDIIDNIGRVLKEEL